MNSEISPENLPQPYSPVFWMMWITILAFMIAISIERNKALLEETESEILKQETRSFIQRPEDLESMLLNFTLLILIAMNLLGYYFHWQK